MTELDTLRAENQRTPKQIIRELCNRRKNSDIRADDRELTVLLEANDSAKCAKIQRITEEIATLKSRFPVLEAEITRWQNAANTTSQELSVLKRERDEACPFAFGNLACVLTRGHDGRHQDRKHISTVMWTTEQSTAKELEGLRKRLEEADWRSIETAPRDGTPIASYRSVRYLPYKPDGKRQMRAEGRWQESNGYGGWENCKEDPAEWRPFYASMNETPEGLSIDGKCAGCCDKRLHTDDSDEARQFIVRDSGRVEADTNSLVYLDEAQRAMRKTEADMPSLLPRGDVRETPAGASDANCNYACKNATCALIGFHTADCVKSHAIMRITSDAIGEQPK
jgi:hypothetical protein